eukprot:COSAG06_NODE_1691_length_8705_cov_95.509877_11_plen_875_part_01
MQARRGCFCLSKARPGYVQGESDDASQTGSTERSRDGSTGDSEDALRAELRALKPSALRRRAAELGISEEARDAADDAEDVAAALTQLILSASPQVVEAELERERALRRELEQLRVMALRERAVAEGVPEDAVEDAMEAEDTKGALIGLMLEVASSRAPEDRLLSTLRAGEQAAADAIGDVLEHAMDVLEQLCASSARQSRKPVRRALESVEVLSDSIDADWCAGASNCGPDELGELARLLHSVKSLVAEAVSASEAVSTVSGLLERLEHCGEAVSQSVALLQSCGSTRDTAASTSAVRALHVLWRLPQARLDTVSDNEIRALPVVSNYAEETSTMDERESAHMAMFTLFCRNGFACRPLDFVEDSCARCVNAIPTLGQSEAELRLCGAACALHFMLVWECALKACHAEHAAMAKWLAPSFAKLLKTGRDAVLDLKNFAQRVAKATESDSTGESLNWGIQTAAYYALHQRVDLSETFGSTVCSVLDAAVEASQLEFAALVGRLGSSAAWWTDTSDAPDVASAHMAMYHMVSSLVWTVPVKQLFEQEWWPAMLEDAISIAIINQTAKLTERETCGSVPIYLSYGKLEIAAYDDSQQAFLLKHSALAGALDYGCANDFFVMGMNISVASAAAGAAVALIGRNELGATLSPGAVRSVVGYFAGHFDPTPGNYRAAYGAKKVAANAKRVVTMLLSDANKKLVLQERGGRELIDSLLSGLLLDTTDIRQKQDQADLLQTTCAEALLSLALYDAGAAALKGHGRALECLRTLSNSGLSKEAQLSADAALFQLERDDRQISNMQTADSVLTNRPHIMVSYNWDHQDVIMRVVGSLQSLGYLVWVDLEQMQGSTVDTMALAVEGSAVVLIGVSRAYKESSNCR